MSHPYMLPVANMWKVIESGTNSYSSEAPEFDTTRILINYLSQG